MLYIDNIYKSIVEMWKLSKFYYLVKVSLISLKISIFFLLREKLLKLLKLLEKYSINRKTIS